MAVRTWNIHCTKSMTAFRIMVLLAAKRDWERILHIVLTCWLANTLLLLTKTKNEHTVKAGCCQDVPFHSLSYLIVILSYHTIWLHQGLNPGPVDTWPGLDPAMIYSDLQNCSNVWYICSVHNVVL